jgi:uncharacterized membrane protein
MSKKLLLYLAMTIVGAISIGTVLIYLDSDYETYFLVIIFTVISLIAGICCSFISKNRNAKKIARYNKKNVK